jgi:ATP-dependent DNA helicase RecQ
MFKTSRNVKSKTILSYFGEIVSEDCGICSYCITKKSKKSNSLTLSAEIISYLKGTDLN